MAIHINNFAGVAPRIPKRALPQNMAQIAQDCDLREGMLKPLYNPLLASTLTKTGSLQSLYLFGGQYWFTWTQDVDVVKSAIDGDTSERTYFTGTDYPRVTDNSIALTGGTNYPMNSYALGLPAPASSPTVALTTRTGTITGATSANPVVITSVGHGLVNGSYITISGVVGMTQLNGNTYLVTVIDANTFSLQNTAGINVDGTTFTAYTSGGTWSESCQAANQISATFYVTYVSGWGEEGPPSGATAVVDICPGQEVTLTLPSAPTGNYNVTLLKIYCAVAGFYQYVGSVAIGTTSYVISSFQTTALGSECPSETWVAPPTTMTGIVTLPNGLKAAFDGNTVLFCEPYEHHAWPIGYRYSVDHTIVGLGVAGSSLVVLTTGTPYIIQGVDPSAMNVIKLSDLPQTTMPQPCSSKRSIVSLGGFVLYASPLGLTSISESGSSEIVTDKWMLRKTWQTYSPTTMHAYYWESAYVCFYTGGSFIFDPANDGLKFSALTADGGFNDLENEVLYLLISNVVYKWNAGTARSYIWKSKLWRNPKPFLPGAVQIIGDTYPVTISIYGDGQLYDYVIAGNSDGIPLIADGTVRDMEIELTGTGEVYEIVLAESIQGLYE